MQCHLDGVQIIEVPKFLAESLSETAHAIELVNPFDTIHPLIMLLQLSRVTSYFDVFSPSVTEYENNDIPKIHFTAKEPPWDPAISLYSKKETHMLDHCSHISIPAAKARDQYMSAQLSHNHLLTMPLMLWTMTILQLHCKPRFRSS